MRAASYEAGLLKAYGRTVREGRFRVVVVDAPHLPAAPLQDYWRLGQAAGYEVFVALPLQLDPQARPRAQTLLLGGVAACQINNQHKHRVESLCEVVARCSEGQGGWGLTCPGCVARAGHAWMFWPQCTIRTAAGTTSAATAGVRPWPPAPSREHALTLARRLLSGRCWSL